MTGSGSSLTGFRKSRYQPAEQEQDDHGGEQQRGAEDAVVAGGRLGSPSGAVRRRPDSAARADVVGDRSIGRIDSRSCQPPPVGAADGAVAGLPDGLPPTRAEAGGRGEVLRILRRGPCCRRPSPRPCRSGSRRPARARSARRRRRCPMRQRTELGLRVVRPVLAEGDHPGGILRAGACRPAPS